MRSTPVVVALAALGVVGCDSADRFAGRNPTAQELGLIAAQAEALERPIGRYVVAGKREFSNGSEIYILDTKSGQVCYYFVASGQGGDKLQKTDMQSCAGSPLDPSA